MSRYTLGNLVAIFAVSMVSAMLWADVYAQEGAAIRSVPPSELETVMTDCEAGFVLEGS
ncbi:MAG: hypothetical protein ACT4NU_01750 [Chromatiales bacterium]